MCLNSDFCAEEFPFRTSQKEIFSYQIGGLLYTPAIREGLVEKLENRSFKGLMSLALCLEDSICDEALPEAERVLKNTLHEIRERGLDDLPLLFVRVRNPRQLDHIHALLGEDEAVLTGYIFPKFDLGNAQRYCESFSQIASKSPTKLYFMPILESSSLMSLKTRCADLCRIKEILDTMKDYVLNVRVGGNDFCNLYGVRRSVAHTIYDVGVVRDALIDILNVFSQDYVVSGPVWEYFGTQKDGEWEKGLRREMELDILNGFVGKTAIHPTQLPVIFDCLSPTKSDFDDACRLLNWEGGSLGVQSSSDKSRMNEVKCHGNWARKIYILGKIYGVKNS